MKAILEMKRNELELEKNNFYLLEQNHMEFSRNNLNITALQADFLKELISQYNPKTILEFGTSNGYSLLAMMSGLIDKKDFPQKKFISIEVDTQQFNKAQEVFLSLEQFVVANQIQLINKNIFDEETLQVIVQQKQDFIFVDCMQGEYEKVLQYILENEFLSENGVIIFENIISHSQSYDFYENLKQNSEILNQFKLVEFPIHNGFLLLQRQ